MATSKCPKCNGTSFENKGAFVKDYKYKLNLIQCATCGVIIGVMPEYDPGALAHDNQKNVEEIKTKLETLEQLLAQLLSRK